MEHVTVDNWKERVVAKEYKRKPEEINKNNDCKWYNVKK